jgi:adenylate cyclase
MGTEIERKFLLASDQWRALSKAPGRLVRQGYLSSVKERTLRVRTAGAEAWITVKGITQGASRAEFEFPIPVADANQMLDELCERPLIEKTRYLVEHDGKTFEIDEFHGENAGLIVAEVELESEEERVDLPPWLGAEVTSDPSYFNVNLTRFPLPNGAPRPKPHSARPRALSYPGLFNQSCMPAARHATFKVRRCGHSDFALRGWTLMPPIRWCVQTSSGSGVPIWEATNPLVPSISTHSCWVVLTRK